MNWLVRHRAPAAVAAIVASALLALLVREPVFEGSLVREMSPDLPELVAARTIAAARDGRESSVIIVSPADGTSIRETFEAIELMQAALGLVIDDVGFRSILAVREQLFFFDLDPDSPVSALLVALRESPQYQFLVSPSLPMFVELVVTGAADQDSIYDAIETWQPPASLSEVRVLAGERLNDDVANSLREDLRVLIPIILLASLLVLFIAFGHWRALLLPAFASVVSTIIVLAIISIAGITINLVTLLALPVVLIVSIANSCHFLAKSAAVGGDARTVDAAIEATLRRVALPYFLSSLTTAIALASLMLGNLAPIGDLGLISSVALLASFALVLLAAPFAIGFYLATPSRGMSGRPVYQSVSAFLANHRRPVAAVLAAICLLALIVIPRLSFHSDPRSFFPDNTEFTDTFRLFEASFFSFAPLRVLVAPVGGSVDVSIGAFEEAQALREAMSDFDGVRGVDVAEAPGLAGALIVTAMVSTADQIEALGGFLDSYAPIDAAAYELTFSSAALVYNRIDARALESLLRSLGWSVLLILFVLAIVFRSRRALAGAVIANLVPLALVLTGAWIVGAPFNLVTAFVFLVVLGIVVDDTIHILHWARSGDRIGGSSIEFSVIWSTVLLCVGLMLCQMSDFPTTRSFGAYCSLALVGAVVSDLTVLPLILRWKRSNVEVSDG